MSTPEYRSQWSPCFTKEWLELFKATINEGERQVEEAKRNGWRESHWELALLPRCRLALETLEVLLKYFAVAKHPHQAWIYFQCMMIQIKQHSNPTVGELLEVIVAKERDRETGELRGLE